MPHAPPRPRWLLWLGRHELVLIVGLLVAAGLVWGFVELADEVIEGETAQIDERLLLALRNPDDLSDPIGPQWIEEALRDVTALGGVTVLAGITAAVVGFLLLRGARRGALLVLGAVAIGQAISSLLKLGVARDRPDLVEHETQVYTASFPSGHSMMAAVTYLTLGALLARLQPSWRLRSYVLILAVLVTVAVGISRVYLGVHWPSDVLGGWTAGAAWACLAWLLARRLQRSGGVERHEDLPTDEEGRDAGDAEAAA